MDGLRQHLSEGGFEIRKWACNVPSVTQHLPPEARSTNSECWLAQSSTDLQELTLGLRWYDTLGYNFRSVETVEPTTRNIYKTLASQYDPLGFIIPFTAKVIIQDFWKHNLGWDDPIELLHLRESWLTWVGELTKDDQAQVILTFVLARSRVAPHKCLSTGAVGGSMPCSRVSPQSWTIPAGAEIRAHNLGLQVQSSIQ